MRRDQQLKLLREQVGSTGCVVLAAVYVGGLLLTLVGVPLLVVAMWSLTGAELQIQVPLLVGVVASWLVPRLVLRPLLARIAAHYRGLRQTPPA
jgi:hypothetical protein